MSESMAFFFWHVSCTKIRIFLLFKGAINIHNYQQTQRKKLCRFLDGLNLWAKLTIWSWNFEGRALSVSLTFLLDTSPNSKKSYARVDSNGLLPRRICLRYEYLPEKITCPVCAVVLQESPWFPGQQRLKLVPKEPIEWLLQDQTDDKLRQDLVPNERTLYFVLRHCLQVQSCRKRFWTGNSKLAFNSFRRNSLISWRSFWQLLSCFANSAFSAVSLASFSLCLEMERKVWTFGDEPEKFTS